MFIARIFRAGTEGVVDEFVGWGVECEIFGVYTQGVTREEAEENVADAFEAKVGREGFSVRVTRLAGDDDAYTVLVEPNRPELLVAEVYAYQHELYARHVDEVAQLDGVDEPSRARFCEILVAVAPAVELELERFRERVSARR